MFCDMSEKFSKGAGQGWASGLHKIYEIKKILLRALLQNRSGRKISDPEYKSNKKESQTKDMRKQIKTYRRPENE